MQKNARYFANDFDIDDVLKIVFWIRACMLSHFSQVQLFVARQTPLSMGILQARILEWVGSSFSTESS